MGLDLSANRSVGHEIRSNACLDDSAYLALMVRDHHREMREFRMESNTVNDATLRDAVDSGKRTIHEHLVEVNKLAHERGVPMPEHVRTAEPPAPPPAAPPSI